MPAARLASAHIAIALLRRRIAGPAPCAARGSTLSRFAPDRGHDTRAGRFRPAKRAAVKVALGEGGGLRQWLMDVYYI
jgi:hypothetical protein